jgi:Holliday junction DNA helicase RuvA
MIASIFGTIRSLKNDKCVIEVGGIGYQLQVTGKTASEMAVGNDIQLHTSMVVREDSISLFGFPTVEERELFELLQTVSGVGPKVSLAITGALSVEEFSSAISRKDTKTLSAVPGIGAKGAQRMILELGTKLNFAPNTPQVAQIGWRSNLVSAMTNLGFSNKEAEQAINSLAQEHDAKYLAKLDSGAALKLVLAKTKRSGIAK